MENDKIGCSAGKTILVDPNAFDGQSSLSNVSVPLEDLSITVQLTTSKKPRTVLTTEANGKTVGESSKQINISFIEGAEINGEKVLTSKFTDLTTIFDGSTDEESLGITNIDIDFNSSFAPLITIQFIDLRGSSVFQNEENITNGENKYATFFQLPYPLYTLTVKGYYGLPVSYCLHMTKFTSRFNSQTGNFEITGSFIGYTYAMLSDMLIGYLKAIQYTKLGKAKYEKLRETQPSLLTLNELMDKISKIDTQTQKISADDPDSIDLSNGEKKHAILDAITSNLLILGQDIDIKTSFDEYKYIIINSTIKDLETKIDRFRTGVKENIALYNDQNDLKIDEGDFTQFTSKKYSGLTMRLLTLAKDKEQSFEDRKILMLQQIIGGKSEDFNKTRSDLYKHIINQGYGFSEETPFDVYDLRKQYQIITDKHVAIDKQIEKLKTSLGTTLRAKVKDTLGLDPTVRNVVNVFTTSVEVFLSVIFDVSAAAAANPNLERTAQLKKFDTTLDTSYDYKKNANAGNGLASNYYPWPDYRLDDDINGLVETYLGEPGVLDIPSDVNELEFIDDLLKAFLTAAAEAEKAQLALEQSTTNWFSVNPLDTRLFVDVFPYQRIEANSYKELVTLIMIRAMTYLGLSNNRLTSQEIIAMATAEIDSVIKTTSNDNVLQALANVLDTAFYGASDKINGEDTRVIKGPLTGNYYYDYILDSSGTTTSGAAFLKIIPINKKFTGNWSPINTDLVEEAQNGNLFLTNYTTTDVDTTKYDDGGIYIKVVTRSEYDAKKFPLPETIPPSILDLAMLKTKKAEFPIDGAGVGFNSFGGAYGIQEFMDLNYGDSALDKLPFRYMFYEDSNFGDKVYNKSNGLGLKRSASGKDGVATVSFFDINGNTVYGVAEKWNEVMNYIDYDEKSGVDLWLTNNYRLHKDYGKTRALVNSYISGNQDVTYPYINFQVRFDDARDGNKLAPVSLFGSRFYYEQISEYSKALLFLHTFPWTGLITTEADDDWMNVFDDTANNTIFDKPEIYNTFGNRTGFISMPKLLVAFIGGMLWRADYSAPKTDSDTGRQIAGGSGPLDPILYMNATEAFIPTLKVNSVYPTKLEYLTKSHGKLTTQQGRDYANTQMTFDNNTNLIGHEYKTLDTMLTSLPEQARQEFKKVFFDFVVSEDINGTSDWEKVKSELQVFNGTGAQWVTAYNTVTSPINMFKYPSPPSGFGFADETQRIYSGKMVINSGVINTTYNSLTVSGQLAIKNYIMFTPLVNQTEFVNNFLVELKDGTQATKTIMDLFTSELIVANMSWKVWQGNDSPKTDQREGIYVLESDLKLYVDTIVDKLSKEKDGLSASGKKKEREQEIFGTDDENLIKLQLYRTCKNIYDKWVGGASNGDNVIFQCGGRNGLDKELAKKANRSETDLKLIDSFRFVTRSFRDIGDDLVVNPVPVGEFLRNNPNSSFYDCVTSLLSANNFDFIPLPSYINYGDPESLATLFKPMSSVDGFNSGSIGPSFVCVYVGQKSKHLDFKNSEYTNDGFDVRCKDGSLLPTLPKDFIKDAESHENKVAVFAVNYSQQNQNIFKDITLDQSEFTETAESMQIMDDIASKGSENNKSLAGQNLYNVYSVRSYKTEIEMMGNAMIQPMMYFQLNNIPMFHGAYMITHVKHSIKPNYMSTHFTGVRIRAPETKLMDVTDLFMSLLDSIDTSSIKKSESTRNFGSTTGDNTGKFQIPNTVAVADLKNKINKNKFDIYKDIKFTQYGK